MEITLGLIAGRHDLPEVDGYVLNSVSDVRLERKMEWTDTYYVNDEEEI